MKNLLPYQGKAFKLPAFFDRQIADEYFHRLHEEIEWQHDEVILFGKRHITKRKTAWYGSKPYQYTYSNSTKVALPFSKTLLDIGQKLTRETGVIFNSCLLNLYADGSEGMGWHSDNEKVLNPEMPIASVSFGALRKFYFKNRDTKERIDILLEHGSLLMMHPPTQEHWLHSLPKTAKVKEPRINLTFRVIKEN
ncbi:alpha-ketoglutarate-dependent dioxygenase AlkB family protein [Cryomorpha ignava]|uniref:alpha-ketoglutarate-dependent dioxygenase AlkB family protein n=1 Tax=Cryomorpha ignava TaxID=101383 RepID=UPI0019542690|nr:alpha-ketoglutarate-dependent dioxygenase AlkB [Cryomorpha ignava]